MSNDRHWISANLICGLLLPFKSSKFNPILLKLCSHLQRVLIWLINRPVILSWWDQQLKINTHKFRISWCSSYIKIIKKSLKLISSSPTTIMILTSDVPWISRAETTSTSARIQLWFWINFFGKGEWIRICLGRVFVLIQSEKTGLPVAC